MAHLTSTGESFEQKNFNQLLTRLNCSLSYNIPSRKEQVNHWIEEEIKFLEIEHNPVVANRLVMPIEKGEIYVHVPFKGQKFICSINLF